MGRWTDELRELQAWITEARDTLTSPTAPEPVEAVALPSPVATPQPIPPICPGWLVVYRDRAGRLRGGCDERPHGTVDRLEWTRGAWTVWLTNGEALSLSRVRSVACTTAEGQVVSAWDVLGCGVDGH